MGTLISLINESNRKNLRSSAKWYDGCESNDGCAANISHSSIPTSLKNRAIYRWLGRFFSDIEPRHFYCTIDQHRIFFLAIPIFVEYAILNTTEFRLRLNWTITFRIEWTMFQASKRCWRNGYFGVQTVIIDFCKYIVIKNIGFNSYIIFLNVENTILY